MLVEAIKEKLLKGCYETATSNLLNLATLRIKDKEIAELYLKARIDNFVGYFKWLVIVMLLNLIVIFALPGPSREMMLKGTSIETYACCAILVIIACLNWQGRKLSIYIIYLFPAFFLIGVFISQDHGVTFNL